MVKEYEDEGEENPKDNNNEKYKPNKESRNVHYINFGEDDQMEIQGFLCNKMKLYFTRLFYVLTLGILRLIFHWYPVLKIKATHTRCDLDTAEEVLIINTYKKFKSYFVKKVEVLEALSSDKQDNGHETSDCLLEFNLNDGRKKRLYQARTIKCMKLTYIWDDEKRNFIKLAGFDKGITREELHGFSGQSQAKQVFKRIIYGNNEISVPVQTVLTLLVLEALTPFYVFQLFSLIVWLCELYLYYTIAIIIMSVVGITTSIIQTRKNQKNLKGTVHSADKVIVSRGNNSFEQIPTTDLVPGDVILIPSNGCEMQCDAVLTSGTCIVNESMLTGESVPITKNPLPNNPRQYKVKEDVSHTLFCGTKIIQTRTKGDEKVLAVVIRTGYLTAKGELVRSILYPPPADFKFESDSYKFIGILGLIAVLGVIYTIVSKSTRNINPFDIIIKSLDLITIAVPPALPAAMTVGKLYALNRLKNNKIFCINSRVINVSGSVDCICFDKTGTLTEDELDMWGVVPVEDHKIKNAVKDAKVLSNTSHIIRGMATCHSLNLINSEVCGDPLDVKMFESIGWSLEDIYESSKGNSDIHHHIVVKPSSIEDKFEIGIARQFQFSSHLQRMSVVTKPSNTDTYHVYCKGSPEMITSLSNSSVPEDILTRLKEYTTQGYRVIALGEKDLGGLTQEEVAKLHREDVECDLNFIGLIVLENKLKPQTTGVIKTLKEANLKVVMITGDNIQTGVHVAKECQMVDPDQAIVEVIVDEATKYEATKLKYQVISEGAALEKSISYSGNCLDIEKSQSKHYCFAITGNSWANLVDYFPELVPKVVAKGVVFARMSGLQKQQLIEEFKNLGYYVAMCGDGANDCGALRAAHVGISLSEAESSVASPFTSKEPNISCLPKVIKEGRAALVTSFGVFKLMLCYSLTEFASVMILYNIDANLTSMQFLFIDICLILNFASFFGITKAYETLDKVPPMTSLMSFIPISSMVLFMLLTAGFQIFSYYYIQSFSWFYPFQFNGDDDKNFLSYENYAVYSVSMFQYITMAVVFSKGKPYRKPLYTNIPFTFSLVVMTLICVYIALYPAEWVKNILELLMPPAFDGRYTILWIALICFLCCILAEDFVVEFLLGKVLSPKLKTLQRSKRKFLGILKDMEQEPTWPRLEDKTAILSHVCEGKANGLVNNGFVGSQNTLVTKF
ncbi:probable cation-transporting ATPase 13A3 [Anoplophora glabripennis]|uniref:probable cation-transporting ATPase 13A3 n=1 Tax=Anoplophora glabripennis TaxID=217634 RepID=UPI000C778E3F|nr:probable cation-transporting ATPase 13A3 [Anoplophora glabripennis]